MNQNIIKNVIFLLTLSFAVSHSQAQSFVRPSFTIVNYNKNVQYDSVKVSVADKNPHTTLGIGMNTYTDEGWSADSLEVFSKVKSLLPVILDTMYKNSSGKVDISKLKAMAKNSLTKEQLIELNSSSTDAVISDIYRKQVAKNYILLISYSAFEENLNNSEYAEGTFLKGNALIFKVLKGADYLSGKGTPLDLELMLNVQFERTVAKGAMPNEVEPMAQKIAMKVYDKMNKKYDNWTTSDYTNAAIQEVVDMVFTSMKREIEDFQIVTKIENSRPIESPIGIKEGLKIDNRYYVYDKVETDSGKIEEVKIATIRAKKVALNSGTVSLDNQNSRFYKIGSGKIEPGMILRNKEDYGIGVALGYGTGNWLRLDYRLKGITPGFKMFIEANPFPGKVEVDEEKFNNIPGFLSIIGDELGTVNSPSVFALNVGLGIEKTIMIGSKLGVTPFVSGGYSTVTFTGQAGTFYGQAITWSTDDASLTTSYYGNGGLRGSIQLTADLSLVVSASYNASLSGGYNDPALEIAGSQFYLAGGIIKEENAEALDLVYNDVFTSMPKSPNGLLWDIMIRYEF